MPVAWDRMKAGTTGARLFAFMAASALPSPTSRIESEVRRIRELMQRGDFTSAVKATQTLRGEVPENRDVLYMLAVSQRYLQRTADAIATLATLETYHPGYSRLFQERGHCYVAERAAEPAIEAYLRAVNLNPTLIASWKALQTLFRMTGRSADAETAASHVATLTALPREILTASDMFADGDLHDAERIVRQFLLKHGNHIEGMRLLARIGMKLDVLDDAEFLLESLLALDPSYHLARYDYATVLSKRHKHTQALAQVRKLLAIDPENRSYRTLLATVEVGLGNHEEAIRIYGSLLPGAAQPAELHLSIAHAEKTLGRQEEAIDSYRAAARESPSYGDAYWSLANLKTYRFTDEELERMRVEESSPGIRLIDRYHLCFALGKALEDRGEYAESFRYYERGNSLRKSESRFHIAPIERNARLQAQICTPELFAARRNAGCDRRDPIFIVGLPRAGSTLLEQILASHSQVEGTMELANIPLLVHQLQGREQVDSTPRYPAVLAELSPEQLRQLGEKYLADTQVYRSGKPFFIDKMPNNFRHLGLIHLILPNARIIDARREPMACCFSNFKQLFASGQEFTYSLDDIARYYRSYLELMAHWDAVLPGKILRIQHEEVVEDLEGNVRRLLEFCELEFEPACLEFYRNERSVRTASSEQVRRPIYKEGLDQWRNFEPWLEPLQQALGDALEG